MSDKNPLILKIACEIDFAVPAQFLTGLTVLAAALSPRPLLMTIVTVAVCTAGWGAYILRFSKVKAKNLALIIFPDGLIRLKSSMNTAVVGTLGAPQWSTRYFAVLRVKVAGRTRFFPVLAHQQQADNYRRLLMWLRQDFRRGASAKMAPGI
jgi:hypothetical protein